MTNAPNKALDASQDEVDAIMRAARDYVDGYTTRDPERHARAYHPESVKRKYVTDAESGVTELVVLSPQTMVDYAATLAPMEPCEAEIVIDAISGGMASVRIYSCFWVDFMHIVKARGKWGILHVTWHGRATT
jgi:Putative lumazine-binding